MSELAPDPGERLDQLTPMEQACLRMVARRLSSKQIAGELGIAKTSVDTYCNRARAKLGVADRYEAARLLQHATAEPPAAPLERPPAEPSGKPIVRARVAAMLSVGFVLVLALATLLAGLRALEDMKPLPKGPPPHDARR